MPINTNIIAQTISGNIQNKLGEPISNATIIVKDSINTNLIRAFAISKNGIYSINASSLNTSIEIEVKAVGYFISKKKVEKLAFQNDLILNFILNKDTLRTLDPVTVTANDRPYKIKGDTISFKVSSYSDGTERKIQDIIKKLPGIEVNEKTGAIKYKGKLVETVKLDGDDLFGDNYTIGTKNINVDMVDEVQAIENYSNNPLLKGLETGDKVALNLTLKNKGIDLSGDIDLGVGLIGKNLAKDISINLLGVSKKYKSFITGSINNIGINNTPFDYHSNNKSLEQIINEPSLAPKYLNENIFNSQLDDQRQNINNNLWTSYNALHKINKKLSIKTNFYYLDDNILAEQFFEDNNTINGQTLITSDEVSFNKKPKQIASELEIKFKNSTSSLIEFQTKYKRENVVTSNRIRQNKINDFDAIFETKDIFFEQRVTYTKRLSSSKAMQVLVKYTENKAPQVNIYNPAIINPTLYLNNTQQSEFDKKNLNFQAVLLGKSSQYSKYRTSLNADLKEIFYNSNLTGLHNNIINVSGFLNEIKYSVANLNFKNQYSFRIKKILLLPILEINYIKQYLVNYINVSNLKKGNFLIQPQLNVSIQTTNYSKLLLSISSKQKTFNETNFISENVLVSNREIKRNLPTLNLQKTNSFSLFYNLLNLQKRFELSSNIYFAKNIGNYFSDFNVQSNQTIIKNFFLPVSNDNFMANVLFSKFIPVIKGTIKFKSSYSKNWYKNFINNSTLRNNETSILSNELFYKAKFTKKITFDNTLKHSLMKTKSENNFSISNASFSNSSQVVYTFPKYGYISFINDMFLPNSKKRNEIFSFFDFIANVKSKKNLFDFTIKLKNILNTKKFIQIETSDFAKSFIQSNLLERHFVFSVSRNF